MKEQGLELTGTVVACHGHHYSVDCGSHVVSAVVGGKLVKHRIFITLGDSVAVEVSPYDLAKGRITKRL